MPTKYIVSKGWEGFGDRLQCLSYCVNSALRYNRTLYVDWTDDIWGDSFYKYFYFVDLPFAKTDRPLQRLSAYPRFWNNKLMLPANRWVYDMQDELAFDPAKDLRTEDVWVYTGIGYRAYDIPRLLRHLRLQPSVVVYIQQRLPDADMPVVHLRGNDRTVSEGMWADLRQKAPVALVISDDTRLVDRWLAESPESVKFSAPSAGVTHFSTNVQKQQMNLALLLDFFVLALAKDAYALNSESLFFKMARLVGGCGGSRLLSLPNSNT